MESVRQLTLGHDAEKMIANMSEILKRGFGESVAAVCWECNQVQELTIEETAKMIAEGTWPRCHEKRTEMIAVDQVPPF